MGCVCVLGVGRLMCMCMYSFVVCRVRKMAQDVGCRDGVKVLWCCSYLVWLVFKVSISTLGIM